MPRNLFQNKVWTDFVKFFFDEAGIFIQAVDEGGEPLSSPAAQPTLCATLGKTSATSSFCQKECRRICSDLSGIKEMVSARCYAGLSSRVVPIIIPHERPVYLIVGRVLTELFGSEQMAFMTERFDLSREEYQNALKGLRYISKVQLDNVSRFVGGLAWNLFIQHRTGVRQRILRTTQRRLVEQVRQLWTQAGADAQGASRLLLEEMTQLFGMNGAALAVFGREPGHLRILAASGPAEKEFRGLESRDWTDMTHSFASAVGVTTVRDSQTLATFGLGSVAGPLRMCPLRNGPEPYGCLFFLGNEALDQGKDLLELSCHAMAAYFHQLAGEQTVEAMASDHLLSQVYRKIFAAQNVDGVLSQSLEAAMSTTSAHRGSIFLIEPEEGKVTAAVLKGSHEELAGKIKRIEPDTVAHEVFYGNHPVLVKDTALDFNRRKKRRYPYQAKSFVSIPIRSNGKALGVLHLTERAGDGAFTDRDLSMLDDLSFETSMAIEKVKLAEELNQLKNLSMLDPLTEVYNRRFLDHHLAVEFQRANRFQHPISLLMVDIDGFKDFNDLLGHAKGDTILAEIAQVLRGQVRSIDLIARFGGDEFMVLLPETGLRGAISIAEKIRASVEATRFSCEDPSRKGKLTVSIGIYTFPDMAISKEELSQKADQALMAAKRVGKNLVLPWSM